MKILSVAALVVISIGLTGCTDTAPKSTKVTEATKANRAAESIKFTENAEIDNIKKRLELTSSSGLLGYATLLNGVGQPIAYYTVKGKITSSGKRLTKPFEWARHDCGSNDCTDDVAAPSDEGTYGSSSPYVYFWTTSGQYIQWSGDYLYSDQPYRLRIEPLVIDSTN